MVKDLPKIDDVEAAAAEAEAKDTREDAETVDVAQQQPRTQQPKAERPHDVLKDRLRIEWRSEMSGEGDDAEETGRTIVSMSGALEFIITEVTDGGELKYSSSFLRTNQDDMRDAMAVALKNAVNRRFNEKWNELNPPEQRERKAREKMSEKAQRLEAKANTMERIVGEMSAAMIESRPVNFDLFDELGVDPVQFGLTRPKGK